MIMNWGKDVYLKMMILVLLTISAFTISYIFFTNGIQIIVQNTLYLPILFACYWFEEIGFAYAVGLSFTYFAFSLIFNPETLEIKLSRLFVFLLFSWLIHKLGSRIRGQTRLLGQINNRLERKLLRLNTAEKLAHLGSWEIDLSTGKTTWSDELFRLFGLEPGSFEPTQEKRIELAHPEDQNLIRESTKKIIDEQCELEIESRIVKPDGSQRWVLSTGYIIMDENKSHKFVGTLQDITEIKLKQDEILYMSYHDSLTGLYNRRFFDEELLRLDTENNLPISIIIVDVNGLKLTNDAFGHRRGDVLLQRTAEALKVACRKEDILARWGGDEFIILLPKTRKKEAEMVADRMKSMCGSMCTDLINITASFGWDTKETINDDIHIVMKNAENEMYINKILKSEGLRGSAINMILKTLHEKNPREEQHSERVSAISRAIGVAMGLSETENNKLKALGLLHDIGKIAIEESVLNKPEKLTDSEWIEIKRHPDIGFRILKSSPEMSELAEYVLAHHERFDGSGYPRGLKTEEIPLLSRIVSVADSYDAMTSDRAYRKALDKRTALHELVKNKGRQFDPQIVDVFELNVFSDLSKGYYQGHIRQQSLKGTTNSSAKENLHVS
ncbi:MAG: diguanylate cyclase [Bacillota bacterium]|nr:diguanylate cyclase [Bacillota bacterium]